jgi:hypothetical protein
VKHTTIPLGVIALMMLSACNPTVKVEAPDKPIVINLNVNISHEIRVKIDKDLDNVMTSKKGIF